MIARPSNNDLENYAKKTFEEFLASPKEISDYMTLFNMMQSCYPRYKAMGGREGIRGTQLIEIMREVGISGEYSTEWYKEREQC